MRPRLLAAPVRAERLTVDADAATEPDDAAVWPAVTSIASASALPSVRLWRVALDALAIDSEADDEWLSVSERKRAEAFLFPADAARYRASHLALRRLLHREARWPTRTEFALGSHGKPTLGRGHPGFNLSHSDAWALIGIGDAGINDEVTSNGVGVDIEHWHPVHDLWRVAQEVLTDDEHLGLRSLPAERLVHGFLRCWTRKEACLKALGSGLSIAPRTFSAGVSPQASDVTISTEHGLVVVRVQSVDAGDDVLASVAMTIGPREPAGMRLFKERPHACRQERHRA